MMESSVDNVQNVVAELKDTTEQVEEKVVTEVVKVKKQVDFLADIEGKALIETIAPTVEDMSIENVMKILPEIIKHVQKYKQLNGQQKKKMIISMLRHIVDITDGPGDDELWDPIIKRLIPSIIDTLVKVDKGKLKLNTNPCRWGLGLFSCCRK